MTSAECLYAAMIYIFILLLTDLNYQAIISATECFACKLAPAETLCHGVYQTDVSYVQGIEPATHD